MTVIVLLIAAGGLVAGTFLIAFLFAVRTGQFDDMTTPAYRMLTQDVASVNRETSEEGASHL